VIFFAYPWCIENNNTIDAVERGKTVGAFSLLDDWSVRSLEGANACIAIYEDPEFIAYFLCCL